MADESAKRMAMLRFGVISPLLTDTGETMLQRFEELSGRIWTLPNGTLRQFTAATIEDWYYSYRKYGFDALVNPPRKDKGHHRCVEPALAEAIDGVLKETPKLRGSSIMRRLDSLGLRSDGEPSEATIYRYLRKVRPLVLQDAETKGRRAFEAPHAGSLYQTDIMYGPYVTVRQPNGRTAKKQTYLIAILDDHSRLACHAEFFLQQGLSEYLNVLEGAIRRRGVPERVYCDNGQVFLSSQVKRIAAEIGTQIIHTKVRDAAAKGKIERWFQTVRSQFLEDNQKIDQLGELKRRFADWMECYNQAKHSSLNSSPMEKWLRSPKHPRMLPTHFDVSDLFWLECTRVVKKDGTFSLSAVRYETNYVYAGQKVTVRYNLQDLSCVHVYHDGAFVGRSYPLNPQANSGLPRSI